MVLCALGLSQGDGWTIWLGCPKTKLSAWFVCFAVITTSDCRMSPGLPPSSAARPSDVPSRSTGCGPDPSSWLQTRARQVGLVLAPMRLIHGTDAFPPGCKTSQRRGAAGYNDPTGFAPRASNITRLCFIWLNHALPAAVAVHRRHCGGLLLESARGRNRPITTRRGGTSTRLPSRCGMHSPLPSPT